MVMINSRKNDVKQDIIILGAGASRTDGAPLQSELMSDFFNAFITPQYVENARSDHQKLKNFFSSVFGVFDPKYNFKSAQFPTFEEALGIIDIAINRQETLKGFRNKTHDRELFELREKFIFMIAKTIKNKLQSGHENHATLLKRLMRERSLKNTHFISLNYDLLIDNAIIDLYPKYHLDYGIDFTNFNEEIADDDSWKQPESNKAINLLKIHGSLNWEYCSTCVAITLTPKEKRVAQMAETSYQCGTCGGNKVPIVIPPTFFKIMSNYYISQIWHQCELMLRQADRLFFCGYSFPDADIHFKYMLKRTELHKGDTPEVYIVNDHDGKEQYRRDEEEYRYHRFFIDKKKINYTTLSFKDFAKKGI